MKRFFGRRRTAAETAVEGAQRPAARAAARRRQKKHFMNATYGPGAEYLRF